MVISQGGSCPLEVENIVVVKETLTTSPNWKSFQRKGEEEREKSTLQGQVKEKAKEKKEAKSSDDQIAPHAM